MLTHLHIGGVHLVVLAHLQRRWSSRVERGVGSSLPPAELARWDSAHLRKLSAYFLLRQWEFWRSRGEKHSPDAGSGSTGRWSRASGVMSVCGSGVQSAPDAGRLLLKRPVVRDVSKCARGVSDR